MPSWLRYGASQLCAVAFDSAQPLCKLLDLFSNPLSGNHIGFRNPNCCATSATVHKSLHNGCKVSNVTKSNGEESLHGVDTMAKNDDGGKIVAPRPSTLAYLRSRIGKRGRPVPETDLQALCAKGPDYAAAVEVFRNESAQHAFAAKERQAAKAAAKQQAERLNRYE